MSQCLRITVMVEGDKEVLNSFVQNQARKFDIEGLLQPITETTFRIIACGKKDSIEEFLDLLHAHNEHKKVDTLEVEPFLKDRDYRGVFRIIE